MKVKDLIHLLECLDGDNEVYVYQQGCDCEEAWAEEMNPRAFASFDAEGKVAFNCINTQMDEVDRKGFLESCKPKPKKPGSPPFPHPDWF